MRRKDRTTRMGRKDRLRRKATLLQRQSGRCYWCHAAFDAERVPTFDHLRSLKAGGTDALTNLVLACEACNNARSNPTLGRSRRQSDGVVRSGERS